MLATELDRFRHIVAELWLDWIVVGRVSTCRRCRTELYWIEDRNAPGRHLPLDSNGQVHDRSHAPEKDNP